MDEPREHANGLRSRIAQLEVELAELKSELAGLEGQGNPETSRDSVLGVVTSEQLDDDTPSKQAEWKWPLRAEEYERYGRQLILPSVGVQGQLRLKAARLLIVGAGGLGCPAAAYLAGAGVGTIGLVDGDTVESSNLHRQIAHATSRVGMLKVDSLIAYLKSLNPLPRYVPHRTHLTPEIAEEIVSQYDIVLDCTDHPTSRYLISDICVLLQKPLVSASALRTDGQLIVLNYPPAAQGIPSTTSLESGFEAGPCYRCVFPRPPPPDSVVSCGEGGILGPVVGVMGVLQAGEALKILVGDRIHLRGLDGGDVVHDGGLPTTVAPAPSLLLFASPPTEPPSFRTVRMRGRKKDCFACSAASTLTLEILRSGSLDYVQFCGGASLPLSILKSDERITASDYNSLLKTSRVNVDHLLLDVREKEHFGVANLDGAVSVPYSSLAGSIREADSDGTQEGTEPKWIPDRMPEDAPIYVICRIGNDSQLATRQLKALGLDRNGKRFIGDIRGGMRAWKDEVDSTLPFT